MGYSTEFSGNILVDPPFSADEIKYLTDFAGTRRMDRANGPFYLGKGIAGQDRETDIRNYNNPPEGQPGLWCQWVPAEDGTTIGWDGGEKFYGAGEWLSYLRSYFIVHRAAAVLEPANFGFLQPHAMSGIIHAVGEDANGDVWRLKADGEGIFISRGQWTDHALREVFKQTDDTEQDDDSWDDYVSSGEAIEFVDQPGMVAWGDWELIPDFATPADEALVAAHREREALNQTAQLADPAKTSASPSI